jgi:putative transposase
MPVIGKLLDNRVGIGSRPSVARHRRALPEIDRKLVSMRALRMSAQEIQAALLQHYGMHLSTKALAAIRKDQLKAVAAWRRRRLAAAYVLVFFGTIRLRVQHPLPCHQNLHVAVAIRGGGTVEIIGLWSEPLDAAGFWDRAVEELRGRGVADIIAAFIADPAAAVPLQAGFPRAAVCPLLAPRLARSSAGKAGRDAALERLLDGGSLTPPLTADEAAALGRLPAALRRLGCTSDPVKSLMAKLTRSGLRVNGGFRSADEALELFTAVFQPASTRWTIQASRWAPVAAQLASCYGGRLPPG